MNTQSKLCDCCGEQSIEIAAYEICQLCGWQDDPGYGSDFGGGANQMSLAEAKAYWSTTKNQVTCGNNTPAMDAIQREARSFLGLNQ